MGILASAVGMPSPGPGPRPPLHPTYPLTLCRPGLGIDEIYEESQQVFLAPGQRRDGQVALQGEQLCPALAPGPATAPPHPVHRPPNT